MDFANLIGIFLGGLGIGGVINAIILHFLNEKRTKDEKLYKEKRDAYIGLLDAIHTAAVTPSDAASKNYALWQTKCNIFGSQRVSDNAKLFAETIPGSPKRHEAFDKLITAIRDDMK